MTHICVNVSKTEIESILQKWLRFKVKDADIKFKTMLINVNKSANNYTRVSEQATSDFRLKAVDNDRATILAQVTLPQLTRIQLTHWTVQCTQCSLRTLQRWSRHLDLVNFKWGEQPSLNDPQIPNTQQSRQGVHKLLKWLAGNLGFGY